MEGLCDVFRSKCIKSINEFQQLCRFQDEKFKRHCSTFIPHIPTGKKKLYYKQIDITQLVVQNMERTLLDSRLAHECNPYKWNKIDKKLRLPVKSVKKKYTDTRTSFRWSNTFLTKSYFTFGLRKTEKGEVHIIQTTAAPIVYYELYKSIHNSYKIDRMFNPADELKFKKYVLQPNRIYLISSGKVYMILTTQKTLFAVDRCVSTLTEEMKQKLKIKLKNPRSYMKFEQSKDHPIDPYEKPPKTPFLDEMTKWTSVPKKRNSEKEKSKAKLTKLFNKPEEEFYQSDGETESNKMVDKGGKTTDIFKRPPPPAVIKKPTETSTIETSPTTILLPENGTLILNLEQQTWPSMCTDSEIPQTELLYLKQNKDTSLQVSDNPTTSYVQPENNTSNDSTSTANDCLLNTLNEYNMDIESSPQTVVQEASFQQQTLCFKQTQATSLQAGVNRTTSNVQPENVTSGAFTTIVQEATQSLYS
ncbi:hypothetical protein X975_09697, partial [Stegodyphus mimosarum]